MTNFPISGQDERYIELMRNYFTVARELIKKKKQCLNKL